jgi:WD40-like Beta Propeller Repeat
LEEFVKFHAFFILAIIALFANSVTISAQVDSVIGQLTNSGSESFAGGISGDGRLVVFESIGNLATENPRNADGNREIFIFDYAQRRIFQITDTKSLRNDTTLTYTPTNLKVSITSERPVISNNGRWIAFSSNATTSTPTAPNATNPGSFDAESFNPRPTPTPPTPADPPNPLLADGNTEIWFYEVPEVAPVNLSAGDELAVTNLSGGTFTRVTNTLPSRLPFPGSSTNLPIIADDNRSASISDDGNYIAFTSNRDLVPNTSTGGNASPNANDEIFTYARSLNRLNQITLTTRGTIVEPTLNLTPTISGFSNGLLRVAFTSNADKPVTGIAEANADHNFEIFYIDLDSTGAVSTTGAKKQITVTSRVNLGDIVNVLDSGRRMSRDGRYIAFDSYADLAVTNGTNQTSFALYLYDTMVGTFRQIGPRSNADATANGGDVPHFPGFTDTDANGTPSTLVLDTRLNIVPAGTVSATNDGGLNPDATRPTQIYSYTLNTTAMEATFQRLTKFPTAVSVIPSTQPIPSNSRRRMTFNLAFTELGTGNSDSNSEAYYFLLPNTTLQTVATTNYATGASLIPVSASPVPTPTPGPTPSPTPTPTGTPSPTPTPTPQTPIAVQGVSPGMLVNLTFNPNADRLFTARTAVGSLSRSFTLPIELSGVTMTINGAAVGLKSVRKGQIVFVVPRGLTSALTGTVYPVVVNNNGIIFRGSITIVPTRPDVFTFFPVPAPNGRARIFNITNTVFRTEPFNVTTLRFRGGRRVPTVLRLFLTGVEGVTTTNTIPTIRIRDTTITPTTAAILREPGIYSFDFTLPAGLLGAGDVPVVVSITAGGVTFQSRLDDTAPQFRIL